jgi:hypothetical protein
LARDEVLVARRAVTVAPPPAPGATNGAAGNGGAPLSDADGEPASGRPAPGTGFRRLPGDEADSPQAPRPARASRPRMPARPALSPTARLWVGRLITFHVVCLAWIFFRATSFHNALEVLGRIGALGARHHAFNWKVAAVIAAALAAQLGPRGVGARLQVVYARTPIWCQAVVFAAVLTTIDLLGPAGIAPFIYFRF